jgi:archaellum component FlaF (FlaF/FlaG flagellin family)
LNVKPKLGWWVNGAQGDGTIVAMSLGWCIYHDPESDTEYAEPWEQISVSVEQPDAPESVMLVGPECQATPKKKPASKK